MPSEMTMKHEKHFFKGEFVPILDCSHKNNPIPQCQAALLELFKCSGLLESNISLYTISGLSKYKKEMYFELILRHLSIMIDKENARMLHEKAKIRAISKKASACMYDGTCGLAIWNQPFKVSHDVYGEVHVFLMLTNAELEHDILQHSCTVFEFASIISSVNVLLHLFNMAGDELEYFKKATEQTKNLPTQLKGSLFESLLLVPYDVPSEKFSYCLSGGRAYLQASKAKQKSDADNVSHFYHNINCFTLARGVDKFQTRLGKKQSFIVQDFSSTFKEQITQLCKFLFKTNLVVKTKIGRPCVGNNILNIINDFHSQSKYFAELRRGYTDTSSIPYLPYFEPISGKYEFIDEVSTVVGPLGATMIVGDCSVEFPKDALLKDTRITLTSYSGKHGKSREVTPLLKCEPHAIQFQKPIKIKLNSWCTSAKKENPVQVWVETSVDGLNWVKCEPRTLQHERREEITFESMHFCFIRCVIEKLMFLCGLAVHKHISFMKKHSNVWRCVIKNMSSNEHTTATSPLHSDSMMLDYSHTTLQLRMSSTSLMFEPHIRSITDAFQLPAVSAEFVVKEKASDSNVVEELGLHEVDFDVSGNDAIVKNNNFFVDFETFQEISEFYQKCSSIRDGDWERFVRLKLHLAEDIIRQAQVNHQNDMKKRRSKMLTEWRKQPDSDTTLRKLGDLVNVFLQERVSDESSEPPGNQQLTYEVACHRYDM